LEVSTVACAEAPAYPVATAVMLAVPGPTDKKKVVPVADPLAIGTVAVVMVPTCVLRLVTVTLTDGRPPATACWTTPPVPLTIPVYTVSVAS
jgi:hypothetical protein